jgi:hypothetical protein
MMSQPSIISYCRSHNPLFNFSTGSFIHYTIMCNMRNCPCPSFEKMICLVMATITFFLLEMIFVFFSPPMSTPFNFAIHGSYNFLCISVHLQGMYPIWVGLGPDRVAWVHWLGPRLLPPCQQPFPTPFPTP